MPPLSLKPYQVRGALKCLEILKSRDSVILGDEMGLGKTATAIRVADKLKAKKILIFCPASLKYVWEGELKKFSHTDREIRILSNSKEIHPIKNKKELAFIVPYSLCGVMLALKSVVITERRGAKWDLVVYDECHVLANPKARQTQVCLGNYWTEIKAKKILISGSVIQNRIQNMFMILSKAAPDLFPSYYEFIQDYCITDTSSRGMKIIGSKNLEHLEKTIRPLLVRRLKVNVLKELPEKVEKVINFPVKVEYKIKPNLIFERENVRIFNSLRKKIFAKKLPFLKEYFNSWSKEIAEPSEPFIVFCYHKKHLLAFKEMIKSLLKLKDSDIAVFTGEVTAKERNKLVNAFQEGEKRLFLATSAASEGITLTRSKWMFIIEMSWSMSKNEQAPDRIHRIGQDRTCEIVYLLADTYLEQVMFNSFKSKFNNKQRALGDKRKLK